MAISTDEKRQCVACLEMIPALATKCKFCGTMQPDAVAARLQMRQLREAAEDGTDEQQETYQQYKLEIAHLPRWLRRLLKTVNFLRENPRVHRAINFVGGLISFVFTVWAVDLGNRLAGPYLEPGGTALRLAQAALGLIAFAYGGTHVFRLCYLMIEAWARLLQDEKAKRIQRGEAEIKAKEFAKAKAELKAAAPAAPAAEEKPRVKSLADLDREKSS